MSIYTEIRANNYRRDFELSGEFDTTSIDAGLVDRVLTLHLQAGRRA